LSKQLTRDKDDRPSVFVLNPYYSGLGIARCLRDYRVPVFGLTFDPRTPGAKSRHFEHVYVVPDGRDDPERLCQSIVEIAHTRPTKPILFPTRDFDVLVLHEHRELLSTAFVLPQPDDSPILRMMDKLELANVAGALGIPTPRTFLCSTADEFRAALKEMPLPVIVKPRFAYEWRRRGVWERVGAQKAFIAQSLEDLRSLYERLAVPTQQVLLQSYIRGVDSDIVVFCCYIDREGNLAGYFTGRKLQQVPALVGTGCVVEATPVPRLVAPSIELLRAFGYRGMAEIEYKYDRSSDQYFLIEINPRHWDQHQLGMLVGVNLTWLAYTDLTDSTARVSTPNYVSGERHKWIAETELATSTLRNFVAGWRGARSWKDRRTLIKSTCAAIKDLSRGKRIYSLSRLDDPLPGLLSWLALARSARVGLRFEKMLRGGAGRATGP
jgi:predicted ATP-grasp superfamily ATP-dependent carboligase